MFSQAESCFRTLAPAVDFCSLRLVHTRHEALSVRRDIVQPVHRGDDLGAMVTVWDGGGSGYAATADLSRAGLARAIAEAVAWARASAGRTLAGSEPLSTTPVQAQYHGPTGQPWDSLPLAAKLDLLRHECARLRSDGRIVEWSAALYHRTAASLYLSTDGSRIEQQSTSLLPSLTAIAHQHGESQTRTFGRGAHLRQGGLEILADTGFYDAAPRIAEEALQLLSAPNCPDEVLDVVLAPDQMVLQIHESIGHPLELDRILGDERNYAGTSFVTPDMFGSYRYGSELLNVTFDPTQTAEVASYPYDDAGQPAQREYLIKDGLLLRPLGSALSQYRAKLPGVANARACNWNRPPIDRMANLNLEPGTASFNELIGQVERGVYMQTNNSWSIDDSRNKFQFGCEYARLIENGQLSHVVKNPNYRGISAEFWRNLAGVGDVGTFEVLGVGNCGKGEPNQSIWVGHATPPCLFRQVAVFGGE